MYLKVCPGYKGKIYLSFVQGYRDKNGKVKQKTIEKIGYLEDLKKIYDDPIQHFKEYKCPKCNKIVRKSIPINLKEDNQYGNNVQATALTLTNIGNVPINKVRKIICGLTMNNIDLSEGYIAKLQKRASQKLEKFICDLKFYIIHLNLVYSDDTVIMVNKNRACMRFYGNEDVALYCAHMQKK